VRILGIDPGLATIGYGCVDILGAGKLRCVTYGCIRTEPYHSLATRLRIIHDDLSELIKLYKPSEAAVEKLYFNKNVTTGISVSHARGVLLLGLEQTGIPVHEYTPLQVKSKVVGYGFGEKSQIQYMVSKILNLSKRPSPDDAADGLALAICHHFSQKNKALKKISK